VNRRWKARPVCVRRLRNVQAKYGRYHVAIFCVSVRTVNLLIPSAEMKEGREHILPRSKRIDNCPYGEQVDQNIGFIKF
jgi:hypothetical protein